MNKSITHIAVKNNLIQPISRQKFSVDKQTERILQNAQEFMVDVLALCNVGYLSKPQLEQLQEYLATIALVDGRMEVVSIFCPSYKTGVGEVGYNVKIGSTTTFNLARLEQLATVCEQHGIGYRAVVYFSDLLLENLERLRALPYQEQLERNFDDCVKHAAAGIEVKKLSSLPYLNATIGIQGPEAPLCTIASNDFHIVNNRNKAFYSLVLGWSDDKTLERTQQLAMAYPYLAKGIADTHPQSLYFWSESALERTRLMPNLGLPLFIPQRGQS